MNVYVLELGWEGGFVVKANSKEEAIQIIMNAGQSYRFSKNKDMIEQNIHEMDGNVYRFDGDC